MRRGKGGRGFNHGPGFRHQQHQRDHEQQVIPAFENMLDPEPEIAAPHLRGGGNAGNRGFGPGGS